MAETLMAAFSTPGQADQALRELEAKGYTPQEISVISRDNRYGREGYDTGGDVAASAGSGAVTGSVIGGLAGLLAGAGILPILAGFFIGGPIAAALGLAGAAATTVSGAVTGAAAGGLLGALMGLGLSRETAASYNETVEGGGVVIGVPVHESDQTARAILDRCGAVQVNRIDLEGREFLDSTPERDAPETGRVRTEPVFGERRETNRNDR